ncbi:capsule biosynthesis protein [Rhodovulum sp. DZ06]|uniref:capsular polysaccharide export protein, LipB/KpsS family n=1 Tax=Rhodovulum sp. DZ06 TaxID=3425126 RepID=UPI003D331082
MTARRILLLQGPSNGFMARLRDALTARGAEVSKVHVHCGEALFWRRPGAVHFHGPPGDWPGWIAALMAARGITDLVLLGACRPGHPEAIAAARAAGIRVHHLELGLLRPGRLSLEPDGPGAHFPRDAAGVRALAARARAAGGPPPPGPGGAGFARYAAADMAWNLAALATSWAAHPGYRRHQAEHPLVEYGGWALKLARRALVRPRAAPPPEGGPLFVFALQLRGDAQVRFRGTGEDLRDTARRVAADFARHAPPGARLLVKPHPMDNGLTPWARIVARATGGDARVTAAGGTPLSDLLPRCAGLVTVNSGAGLEAILAGRPAKALGRAAWDIEGLAHRGPLAGFWQAPPRPDPALAADLALALDWAAHVPGGFDGPAAPVGAVAAAERILAPPRLVP